MQSRLFGLLSCCTATSSSRFSLLSQVNPSLSLATRLNPHHNQSFDVRCPSKPQGDKKPACRATCQQINTSGALEATPSELFLLERFECAEHFKQAYVRARTFNSLRGVKTARSGLHRIKLCRLIFPIQSCLF